MANYANLLATIAANIYTNNNNEVTAAMVKSAVDQMVASLGAGYQFIDVATPATNPGTPDYKCFYIASTPGTYTNFGGIVVYHEICVLAYDSAWTKKTFIEGVPDVSLVQGFFNKIGLKWTDMSCQSRIKSFMCKEGDVFFYRGYTGGNAAGAIFYGEDGQIVSVYSAGNSFGEKTIFITIPANVYFVSFVSSSFSGQNPRSFIVENIKDIANLNIATPGEYVGFLRTDGLVSPDATFHSKTTAKVPCSPGDVFYYRGYGVNLATSYLLYTGDTIVSYGVIDNHLTPGFRKVEIPENVDGVVFSSLAPAADEIVLDVYRGDFSEIIDFVYALEDAPLVGKKINWLGDSYVANNGQPISETWHSMIAAKYGMVYRNYGINGTGIVSGSTGRMDERYVDMDPDADYVMVVGGTNDFNNQIDPATFKARLATFIANLVAMYPMAKIAFWTPWNANGVAYPAWGTKTYELAEYGNAIEEVCHEWGVPCFNATKYGGVLAWDAGVRADYFQGPTDYAHLNADGHKFFMTRAEQFLIGL